MLITGCSLIDGSTVDIRIRGNRIDRIAPALRPDAGDEDVIELGAGTVIPGLHDHHIHLRAAAAAQRSVPCGPPDVTDSAGLATALRDAATDREGWVRGIGYHESVAGDLDRHGLDRLSPARPLRVQHRSGAMWFVNSAGLRLLGIGEHPTGRLFREDREIRVGSDGGEPDLAGLSRLLHGYGVTGVTEATPDLGEADYDALDGAVRRGELRQRVLLLGAPGRGRHPRLGFGAVKKILDDDLIDPAGLEAWIREVHDTGRPVAVHCVTRLQAVVMVAALENVGTVPGDRIEHGAMIPEALLARVSALGVGIVTQPNFVAERGDAYLAEIPADELGDLWRIRSLREAGIPVAGSTDAPFGHPDPWRSMRAARDRLDPTGVAVGPGEAVEARVALALFLGGPRDPAAPRRLVPGMPADLCLLGAPPEEVLAELSADVVVGTVFDGEVVTRRW